MFSFHIDAVFLRCFCLILFVIGLRFFLLFATTTTAVDAAAAFIIIGEGGGVVTVVTAAMLLVIVSFASFSLAGSLYDFLCRILNGIQSIIE